MRYGYQQQRRKNMVSAEVPEVFTGKQMKDVSIRIVKGKDVSAFMHGVLCEEGNEANICFFRECSRT